MFKQSFKYYKSRKPPPDLNEVLDFNLIDNIDEKKISRINVEPTAKDFPFGLLPFKNWQVYSIKTNPGLIFIKNPFTEAGGRYWVMRCLKDYTRKPNKLNIDAHNIVPANDEWWEFSKKDPSILKKLRWSTLGYHHDWDTKVYSEESRNDFPSDLAELCSHIGNCLNFNNFTAEAAIVNFYHLDSTLSGHTDHSEKNLAAPLFSFSFGNSAIFLIGGETIDVKPAALMLHHGDILIMSKESRVCYHGVPRILYTWTDCGGDLEEIPDCVCFNEDVVKQCVRGGEWKECSDYLRTSRINVNVRQVLRRGQKRLSDD